MCCGLASMAESAIRPHGANCAAVCRSASFGARPMARSAFIPTRLSSPPFATCLRALPRWDRRVAFGFCFRPQGLTSPPQMHGRAEIRWVEASYTAIHQVLTNPVYAGAYVYGKTRQETILDASGARKTRIRHLPRSQWQVLIPEHHPGFIDWQTYEANQQRLAENTRPEPHKSGGAVREGGALLQGLASCGHCGRRLHTHYRGRNSSPGYHCAGKVLIENRGVYCLNIGGVQIDDAITQAFIAALEPATLTAALTAAERLEADREAALKQWLLAVERANYEAQRAERRYRAVDPDNRLVARGLEREWEECLKALEAAKADLARRKGERPYVLSHKQRDRLLALGPDLISVWNANTTMPRDRKELLRTLIDEVIVKVERDAFAAHLTLRWKGGALTEIDLDLPRSRPATIRTDEDTVALLRRLAVHYPDAVIAGILNRQGRKTAYGHRFDRNRVSNLRRHWSIPSSRPTASKNGVAPEHHWLLPGRRDQPLTTRQFGRLFKEAANAAGLRQTVWR